MKRHMRPLNRSITIGCIVFIITLCVILSVANLTLYKDYVYRDYRNYISELLNYAMAHIDGDDLEQCIETTTESESYKEMLLFMDDMMEYHTDIHYFYAVLPLNTDDTGNVMSVFSAERYYDRYIDTEGNLYLGWISDDEFDAETALQFMSIMQGEEVEYFIEETEWGLDYTGATPIRNSQGKPIAVLAIDIDISFIQDMIVKYAAVNISLIALMGIIFIIIFLMWSRGNITEPIKRLEESAVGFADRSHGQRDISALNFEAPEIHADNEVKALSDAVVKMSKDMQDYVTDIISAETKAADMQELAHKDALTGVRNKTAYNHEQECLNTAIRNGESKIGIAVVDLNFLKRTNDTYGHDKGDLALRKLCRMICVIFEHSPVFRIGGDEFVIVLRGSDYDNISSLLDRFKMQLKVLNGNTAIDPWERVSAAIGVALYDPAVDKDVNSIFQRADSAMYECKVRMKAVRTE